MFAIHFGWFKYGSGLLLLFLLLRMNNIIIFKYYYYYIEWILLSLFIVVIIIIIITVRGCSTNVEMKGEISKMFLRRKFYEYVCCKQDEVETEGWGYGWARIGVVYCYWVSSSYQILLTCRQSDQPTIHTSERRKKRSRAKHSWHNSGPPPVWARGVHQNIHAPSTNRNPVSAYTSLSLTWQRTNLHQLGAG